MYYLFNGPEIPDFPPIKYTPIKMKSSEEGTVSWSEDVGLEINFNAGDSSNKDYIFPPKQYTIIATTEFNSWNNHRYRTTTLEAGNIMVELP